MTSTLNDNRPPATICRENGWAVGTQLTGSHGDIQTVIEITAIGPQIIMAKLIAQPESIGTLGGRDWREVTGLK